MEQRSRQQMVQNVEGIHNAVKKQASNANLRVGARMVWFKFKRPSDLGEPSSGKMVLIGEKEEDGKFFIYSLDSIDEMFNIAQLSLKLRTPFLLPVKLMSLTYVPADKAEELVLCYDPFDNMFSHWIEKNPQEPFSADEEPLNEWWRTQIRNLLDTLAYMHERKAFHGNLNQETSYVVMDRTIHLINASVDGSKMDGTELERLALEDTQALKNFLKKYVLKRHTSTDWDYFIDSFDISKIGELMKHPVLIDSVKRFKYFRDIFHYIRFDMTDVEKHKFDNLLVTEDGNKFKNWNTKIPRSSVLHDVYAYDSASYGDHGHAQLLRYLEKVFDHFNERARQSQAKPLVHSRDEIEKIFSLKYPGFLSYIHGIFIKLDSSNISPVNLRS